MKLFFVNKRCDVSVDPLWRPEVTSLLQAFRKPQWGFKKRKVCKVIWYIYLDGFFYLFCVSKYYSKTNLKIRKPNAIEVWPDSFVHFMYKVLLFVHVVESDLQLPLFYERFWNSCPTFLSIGIDHFHYYLPWKWINT